MGNVKVFVLYHKPMPVFKSEVFMPLQTGCDDNMCIDGFLHDNVGDNISYKNRYFAELTGNYWVWKNYLPMHPDLEYVGFCHYRRNWDLRNKGVVEDYGFVRKMVYSNFEKYFRSHSSEAYISKKLEDCDIMLPGRISFAAYGISNLENYKRSGHSEMALDVVRNVIQDSYPDYMEDFNNFFSSSNGYYCLNYIMRRAWFVDYMTWLFAILDKVGEKFEWDCGDSYEVSKMPAYIAERLFNVWICNRTRKFGLKIIEKEMVLLVEPIKGFRKQCMIDSFVRFYHRYFRKENKS